MSFPLIRCLRGGVESPRSLGTSIKRRTPKLINLHQLLISYLLGFMNEKDYNGYEIALPNMLLLV